MTSLKCSFILRKSKKTLYKDLFDSCFTSKGENDMEECVKRQKRDEEALQSAGRKCSRETTM